MKDLLYENFPLLIILFLLKCLNIGVKIFFTIDKPSDILLLIKSYRIDSKDMLYTLFMVFLYFCLSFLIFAFIRWKYLNISINPYIYFFQQMPSLLKLILLLLCIYYYFKILKQIFYKSILSIHIYLSKYEKYRNFVDIFVYNPYYISSKLTHLQIKMRSYSLYTEKEKIEIIKSDINFKKQFNPYINTNAYDTLEFKTWEKIQKTFFRYYFYKYFSRFLDNIEGLYNISRMIKSLPFIIVLLSFIYDLHNYEFYYFFFSLFFYFICNTLRKIRQFFQTKFTPNDFLFNIYIYKDDNILFDWEGKIVDKSFLENKIILLEKIEYQKYINNDLIRDTLFLENDKIAEKQAKRYFHILLTFLSTIYFYCFNNYTLKILMISIDIKLYCISIGILLVYIQRKIEHYDSNRGHNIEKTKYKRVYQIILILFALPILFVIIKNKIILNPNEIIFEIPNILKIDETFTLQDKLNFIKKYINYLYELEIYTVEEKDIKIKNIQEQLMKSSNLKMEEIIKFLEK